MKYEYIITYCIQVFSSIQRHIASMPKKWKLEDTWIRYWLMTLFYYFIDLISESMTLPGLRSTERWINHNLLYSSIFFNSTSYYWHAKKMKTGGHMNTLLVDDFVLLFYWFDFWIYDTPRFKIHWKMNKS